MLPNEFEAAKARLSGGAGGLLPRMVVVEEIRLAIDCVERYCHVGQVELRAMVRNSKNRWVLHHAPTARCCAKLGGYTPEMGNCAIQVSAE